MADERLLTPEEMAELAKVFPEGFTGRVGMMIAKAQLDKDEKRFVDEKAEYGLSVHEAAWKQATKEANELKLDRPDRDKLYDIVLAIRTEGVVHGKTKDFARADTDQILALLKGESDV